MKLKSNTQVVECDWAPFFIELGHLLSTDYSGLSLVVSIPSAPTIPISLVTLGGILASFSENVNYPGDYLDALKTLPEGTVLLNKNQKLKVIGENDSGYLVLERVDKRKRKHFDRLCKPRVLLRATPDIANYQPVEHGLIDSSFMQSTSPYPHFNLVEKLNESLGFTIELSHDQRCVKSRAIVMVNPEYQTREVLTELEIEIGDTFVPLCELLSFEGRSWSTKQSAPYRSSIHGLHDDVGKQNDLRLIAVSDPIWFTNNQTQTQTSKIALYDRRSFSARAQLVESLHRYFTLASSENDKQVFASLCDKLPLPIGVELIPIRTKKS